MLRSSMLSLKLRLKVNNFPKVYFANVLTTSVKMNSLYKISSKMLHSTKVIILVEKERKEVAWLGFELTTSMLKGKSANHYTIGPS